MLNWAGPFQQATKYHYSYKSKHTLSVLSILPSFSPFHAIYIVLLPYMCYCNVEIITFIFLLNKSTMHKFNIHHFFSLANDIMNLATSIYSKLSRKPSEDFQRPRLDSLMKRLQATRQTNSKKIKARRKKSNISFWNISCFSFQQILNYQLVYFKLNLYVW